MHEIGNPSALQSVAPLIETQKEKRSGKLLGFADFLAALAQVTARDPQVRAGADAARGNTQGALGSLLEERLGALGDIGPDTNPFVDVPRGLLPETSKPIFDRFQAGQERVAQKKIEHRRVTALETQVGIASDREARELRKYEDTVRADTAAINLEAARYKLGEPARKEALAGLKARTEFTETQTGILGQADERATAERGRVLTATLSNAQTDLAKLGYLQKEIDPILNKLREIAAAGGELPPSITVRGKVLSLSSNPRFIPESGEIVGFDEDSEGGGTSPPPSEEFISPPGRLSDISKGERFDSSLADQAITGGINAAGAVAGTIGGLISSSEVDAIVRQPDGKGGWTHVVRVLTIDRAKRNPNVVHTVSKGRSLSALGKPISGGAKDIARQLNSGTSLDDIVGKGLFHTPGTPKGPAPELPPNTMGINLDIMRVLDNAKRGRVTREQLTRIKEVEDEIPKMLQQGLTSQSIFEVVSDRLQFIKETF